MSHTIPGFRASADINPRRFLKITAITKLLSAERGKKFLGLSAPGTEAAPIPGASTLAAASGNSCRVFCLGEVCEVDVGATAVVAGDWVKADANAKAIPGHSQRKLLRWPCNCRGGSRRDLPSVDSTAATVGPGLIA